MIAILVTLAAAAVSEQPAYCLDPPYGIDPGELKPFICSRAFEPSKAPGATTAQRAGGPSLNWPSRKAAYYINQIGTPDIPGPAERTVIRQGFATWTVVPGAQFEFEDAGLTSSQRVGFDFRHLEDNSNIVLFQDPWPHDAQIIGLTTATFNAQTGEIFDADIELNDENYEFTIGDDVVKTDLLNTVTHEVGHFLGFDHTDKDGSTIDPECARTSTMSKTSSTGEISKRVLSPSDELGMIFVYPANGPIGYCNPPSEQPGPAPQMTQVGSSLGGACAASRGDTSWSVLCAWAVLQRLRRRSSKSL